MDIIDSARDRSTVVIIDVIDSAGDWSSIFITLECSQTRYRSSITVIVVIYSPGVLSRLLVRGNISSLLTMVFMVLSRTVLGRAYVRRDDRLRAGNCREWKTRVTLLLHRDGPDHLGALLRSGLVTLGLRSPVADGLGVAGLGRHLATRLGVSSAVVALSLVDLDTFLVDFAVLLVGGVALLVVHGGALLEHLLLHHRHRELAALLTLHLLGLQGTP